MAVLVSLKEGVVKEGPIRHFSRDGKEKTKEISDTLGCKCTVFKGLISIIRMLPPPNIVDNEK